MNIRRLRLRFRNKDNRMGEDEMIAKINGLLRKWFQLQAENEPVVTLLIEGQKFKEVSSLKKKEDKFLPEIIALLKQCREAQVAINLHLDNLRDRYYRDSIRVWDYDEFTSFIRHFGLPDLVLFEYDVDTAGEGYECAKFLIIDCLEKNVPLPPFKVYGISPGTGRDVASLLTAFQKRTQSKSF